MRKQRMLLRTLTFAPTNLLVLKKKGVYLMSYTINLEITLVRKCACALISCYLGLLILLECRN